MVLAPSSSSSSRINSLKSLRASSNLPKTKSQHGINEYLQKIKPVIPQQQSQKAASMKQPKSQKEHNSPSKSVNSDKILDGVVACLDVRTEDGDDVSQNFERALQSMGAKTRRTFSDSVTHLIFKNGSPATLKKALSKKVFILNLLWISRCKREGKRLPENDFIIEKPQGLMTTAKKRRRSMEPSKVKALNGLEPSLSTSSEGSVADDIPTPAEIRRKTIATTSKEWTSREFKKSKLTESEMRKRHIEQAEEDNVEVLPPRLSLPVSVERRRIEKPSNIIPIHAPKTEVQEQIKARFSIGHKVEQEDKKPAITPLIKRKRRLTKGE